MMGTRRVKTMIIPSQFEGMRLIPLSDYTKIASVKWANDERFNIDESAATYGVDTGRSGLVVVDCDVKNDVDGTGNYLLRG